MKPTAIILDIENLSENLKNSDLFEDVSIRRDHINATDHHLNGLSLSQ